MKIFFYFFVSILLLSCANDNNLSKEQQLDNLKGKWVFEEPNIEYYLWDLQDSTYIGAKYSIIEGQDSLVELHSIQKKDGVLNYEISNISSDYPTSMEFSYVETEQKPLKFVRKDSVFPNVILLDVHPNEFTITQKGLFGQEEITLPLTYSKQNR